MLCKFSPQNEIRKQNNLFFILYSFQCPKQLHARNILFKIRNVSTFMKNKVKLSPWFGNIHYYIFIKFYNNNAKSNNINS